MILLVDGSTLSAQSRNMLELLEGLSFPVEDERA